MFELKKVNISGAAVLPIVEGGKGVNISTGVTAGSFALAGAVGTVSGTNADYYDASGKYVPYYYDKTWTRLEKFYHLIEYSIAGAVAQTKIAKDIANNSGRVHLNLLWEAGGTKIILDKVLEKTKGLLNGITCGAGLPYFLSDIAEKYNVYYYPIISSARAFKVLWKRSYHKNPNLLGGVVYEDPWLAGGHNGLSNLENPNKPADPYSRIVQLRTSLNERNLAHIPIFVAGGVWNIKEWEHYIDNPQIGLVAFQFGTRPLLTKESPISNAWKALLPQLQEGEIILNKFSPTGFYSSAINNSFLKELAAISKRQMPATRRAAGEFTKEIPSGNGITNLYIRPEDYDQALAYIKQGFSMLLRTPDKTVVFVTPEKAKQINADQNACMGCLSRCRFSNWEEGAINHSTGILPDPRSFCIQKTLQDVGHGGNIDNNLLFAGHQAYRFATDPLYKNGYVPTIAELVDKIKQGL